MTKEEKAKAKKLYEAMKRKIKKDSLKWDGNHYSVTYMGKK
jgi:hypothetical protein